VAQDQEGFANDFAVGELATSQISHTKGVVLGRHRRFRRLDELVIIGRGRTTSTPRQPPNHSRAFVLLHQPRHPVP